MSCAVYSMLSSFLDTFFVKCFNTNLIRLCAQKHMFGLPIDAPCRGTSTEYPQYNVVETPEKAHNQGTQPYQGIAPDKG